jgi:curved DNA-binding protein CbpA
MKNRRNYYRILHVQPDAPRDIIKASYRTLMQKLRLHPDLGGDEWNAAVLNEAYATLSRSERRQAYDREYLQQHGVTGPGSRQRAYRQRQHGYRPEPGGTRRQRDANACPFCLTPKPGGQHYNETAVCSGCMAPLQPVTRIKPAGISRRAVQRIERKAALRYFTRAADRRGYHGTIRDLSTQGISFLSARRLREDQVIRVTMDLLGATARVTYCRPGKADWRYLIGLEFLTLCFHAQCGTFVSDSA